MKGLRSLKGETITIFTAQPHKDDAKCILQLSDGYQTATFGDPDTIAVMMKLTNLPQHE